MLISVIIPLSNNENDWKFLCSPLLFLPKKSEIIFIRKRNASVQELSQLDLVERMHTVHWISAKKNDSRAVQMNEGAKFSSGDYLWFLHADSYFDFIAVKALLRAIRDHPNDLLYFNLKFKSQGLLTRLNSMGANLRSKYLKIPFGDQGFCLSKKKFIELGGYNLKCSYGEDHLFVWTARLNGVEIRSVEEVLMSSDRKYLIHGWLKTSLTHIALTTKQAFPFVIVLFGKKFLATIKGYSKYDEK